MVSNIDNYAPYIRAIFDNAPYEFPYTIADESIVSGNNLFNAIGLLLSLQSDSFKAEEVLELLESKYIRTRFGITDVAYIRKAVHNAHIRFGIVGETENETRLVSWEYGLQRMMSGLCISGEPIVEWGNEQLIPLDHTEGANSLELVRFWHFMQMLQYTVTQRNDQRSIAAWGAYLQEMVENMVFQSGEKEEEDYHRFIVYLEKLTLIETVSDTIIGFEVFRDSFLEILQTATKKQAFASAGITFCSLIPMRSIPFKVVAMLGMDFDKFPRKENKLSFNLLEQQKRKGDRNVKENDKHLFLETILSAEKYFYLSYIGNSAKDAGKIPPSSMVDELVAYIIRGIKIGSGKLRDKIITHHPLHGFSQQYFNGGRLQTYLSDDKYKNNISLFSSQKTPTLYPLHEISVTDLQRFFKDPIKWYFNKALSIYFREEPVLLADTELFTLEGLDSLQIKNELLHLDETEYESYFQRKSKLGELPLKNNGRQTFDHFIEAVRPMKKRLSAITAGAIATPYLIDLTIGDSNITGKINNLYGNKMVAVSESKTPAKNVTDNFVTYLIATAQGLVADFYFIPFNYIENYTIPAGTISTQQATELLIPFITNFKSGFQQPFLFWPSFKLNPFDLFATDASGFVESIEKMRKDTYDFSFKNDYMIKAYENAFFSASNFDSMKANTLGIFKPIEKLMPGIINK